MKIKGMARIHETLNYFLIGDGVFGLFPVPNWH